jgi:hypothetical protein
MPVRDRWLCVVGECVLAGPHEQLTRQASVGGRQMRGLDHASRVFQVRQHQAVAMNISWSQGQHLADARAGRPQRREQQTVTLSVRRVDDGANLD